MFRQASFVFLFLGGILFSSSFTHPDAAEELTWEAWNSGYPRGIKEKKIILVDAYTDWCGWCKKMDRDTYANQEIIKKINKSFVPVKFNPELKQTYYIDSTAYSGRELHAMLSKEYSTGYPTTYFILTTKNKIFINPGYENAEQFAKTLDRIVAAAK
ncbi:MAG: thioredoxin family protein [Bacteroidetes bacterium]|nr:MAG: thioredoxin family protein [Bacteroidota bacterium]